MVMGIVGGALMAHKKKKLVSYLAEDGFRPTADEESAILLKIEAGIYIIALDATDENYYQIIYPNFLVAPSADEKARFLMACDVTNAGSKLAKCFMVGLSVHCVVQALAPDAETFYKNFVRYVSAIKYASGSLVKTATGGRLS